MLIEYKVRPVTRFIVTRYYENEGAAEASRQIGSEYANEEMAYQVAYALCSQEHERLGWGLDDERIRYPAHPDSKDAVQEA